MTFTLIAPSPDELVADIVDLKRRLGATILAHHSFAVFDHTRTITVKIPAGVHYGELKLDPA